MPLCGMLAHTASLVCHIFVQLVAAALYRTAFCLWSSCRCHLTWLPVDFLLLNSLYLTASTNLFVLCCGFTCNIYCNILHYVRLRPFFSPDLTYTFIRLFFCLSDDLWCCLSVCLLGCRNRRRRGGNNTDIHISTAQRSSFFFVPHATAPDFA